MKAWEWIAIGVVTAGAIYFIASSGNSNDNSDDSSASQTNQNIQNNSPQTQNQKTNQTQSTGWFQSLDNWVVSVV